MTDPRRGDLRGAVIEAVTEGIRSLDVTVEPEVTLEIPGELMSPPIDLAVDGDPIELYQCKSDPWRLDARDMQVFETCAARRRSR